MVSTAKSRSAPSSWLDEVRSFSGQSGQVSSLFSCSGGCGMISNLVTDSAPWRIEVPMQSEPVSPPPMTTTCLPLGEDRLGARPRRLAADAAVLLRQEIHGEMDAVELAPGDRQVARLLGAAGEHHRVVVGERALSAARFDADMGVVVEDHALGLHLRHAPVDVMLLHLEVGNAVAQQAAGLGVLLVDVHVVAGARELLRAGKAGRPRADDRDASCRSCSAGGSGLIQPSAMARSAMAHSIVLMVTGLSSMLSVQDASHGAGQTRPVTSGKLLVECRLRAASSQSPR